MSAGIILLGTVAILLTAAALSDLLTMKIPNWLSLAMAGLFPVAALIAGFDMATIGSHFLAGAGVLAVCFALFALGWIGGGDAKLAAAIAVWTGPFLPLLEWSILAAVFGGILTLAILVTRMFTLPVMLAGRPWIARLHDPKTGIPYGVALAAAALAVFPELDVFTRLAA